VFVEGPLDVLAIQSSNGPGPLVGVAPCGTAMTPAQVKELARTAHGTILLAFDSDTAGTKATARAYRLLGPEFPQMHAVRMATGTDPAQMLEKGGPQQLRHALAESQPLAARVVDDILQRYDSKLKNAEARVSALRELAPVVVDRAERDVVRQVARLTGLLGLDHHTITRELIEAVTSPTSSRRPITLGHDHQSSPIIG
jgi:DNA primase